MMKNENGRSMIEMLGVLAIIGVLSVGGIYGYTVAMRKYKANEIVQTASMLATMAHSADAGTGAKQVLSSSGLNEKPAGLTISMTAAKPDNNSVSQVDIGGITDDKLCAQIKSIAPSTSAAADDSKRVGYWINGCGETAVS